MQAKSNFPKDAHRHMPFLADQGIPNMAGAFKQGVSIQHLCTTMPNGGVIVFSANGLGDMENGNYAIIIQNHSDAADEATVARVARLTTQFTIVGPDNGDELDIVVIGQLKGQLKTALSA
jgi:hypothetical protein